MGKTIQIRDVPEEVHQALRVRAAAAGQSLSAYLLDEVSRVASRPTVAEVLRRAASRGETVDPVKVVETVRAIREDR